MKTENAKPKSERCTAERLENANRMWAAYAKQAGGKTFDGKPLPTWDELGAERQSCWLAAYDAIS